MYVHDTSFKKLLPFERDRKLNSKMREIEKNTMYLVCTFKKHGNHQ